MKSAHACFVWHMHQPYYTDPVSGVASMPWVRLHAIKAYYDMASMIERFPGIHSTFNFTPSLLVQLKEMAAGAVRDSFLEVAQKPAGDLTAEERAFLVRHFFAANWSTMVRPYPRYHELLVKRGTDMSSPTLDRLARQFSTQDLLDLQVWHNLTWFGYGSLARHPQLQELKTKDRGFTEDEKHTVLALQRQTIGEIIPFYRRLAESGLIELTTTPFYHPILPLIIDTDFAHRSRPEAVLPPRFQAPSDAEVQLKKSAAFFTELFGRPPVGLWPSEGSVCPEMVPMVRGAGFRWMATDEGVLARSLPHWNRAVDLYRPHWVGPPYNDVAVIFRDREISDAFGFVYAKWTPDSAVDDVFVKLDYVVNHVPYDHAMIPIILDGENPWESFHDGGQQFLSTLYRRLGQAQSSPRYGISLQVNTVQEYLAAHQPTSRIEHLHSGSWINQDFKIWIGHPEDNRGWELLRMTRSRLLEVVDRLPPEQAQSAWEELYAAEGSDWFWWYGDDFETDYKGEFDRLFRLHLQNVFMRAGLTPPAVLNEPVIGLREPERTHQPGNLISPMLDGLVSDFFEWHGAGTIDPSPPLGAMWRSDKYFSHIGFGFNFDTLFVRLDPGNDFAGLQGDVRAEVHLFTSSWTFRLVFPLVGGDTSSYTLWSAQGEEGYTEVGAYSTICRRKIIELSVPFKDLHLEPGQLFRLAVLVTHGGMELARYPRLHPVSLAVPDHNYQATMWRV